jgi:hypothetical protein
LNAGIDTPRLTRQRRHELAREHLTVRLALTAGGALVVVIGSAMPWTHGLAGVAGPVTDGRLSGDGRYTALLALVVIGCAAWYYARPENRAARVGAALAAVLLLRAIIEWNMASDDVETANHDAGLFAHAEVSVGVWVLLAGAVVAAAGAFWTLRVNR